MSEKDEKLIKILTVLMEEYGMPKFTDDYPARDILQRVKDAGYAVYGLDTDACAECRGEEK